MSRIIYVLLITSVAFSSGYAFAQSPGTSQESVEVVAGGKIYPSLHAYKLQKLKDDLRGVLSPGQLREFSGGGTFRRYPGDPISAVCDGATSRAGGS